MNTEMRLRSHTARKHFPPLPDDIWTIILDMMVSFVSIELWKQRCKLVRTAKCFALTPDSRLPFQREKYSPEGWCRALRCLGNGGTSAHMHMPLAGVLTSFVPRTTAISYFHDFSSLRTLDMLSCILSYSDQLSLSMVPWPNLRYCRLNDCGLKDRPTALFLKQWMLSIGMSPRVIRVDKGDIDWEESPVKDEDYGYHPSKIEMSCYLSLEDNRLLGDATFYQIGLMLSCWMHFDLCIRNTICSAILKTHSHSYFERGLENRYINMVWLPDHFEPPNLSVSFNTFFEIASQFHYRISKDAFGVKGDMHDFFYLGDSKVFLVKKCVDYMYNTIRHLIDLPNPLENVKVRLTMNQNARRGMRSRVPVNWSLV